MRIDKKNKQKLQNNAGNNPYMFNCPWCGALKGNLCKDEKGNEYLVEYHRARLMKDCLEANHEI